MGGVALLPGVGVVVGRLHLVMVAMDMLRVTCSPSSEHDSIGLVEQIRHVLYALRPTRRVAVPPGGVLHSGGSVSRGRGLPLDVAAGRLPGFEGGAGEQRVCGGLGQV